MAAITFVLGGARSGKSAFAEGLTAESGKAQFYIATSQIWDEEMRARIDIHKARRGPEWTSMEAPLALAEALQAHDAPSRIILVDCLTLWVTNLMMAEADIAAASRDLCATLRESAGDVVLVSNEVGLGIVPDNKMARDFRDHAGRLHQDIGQIADKVYFVVAGLPLALKG